MRRLAFFRGAVPLSTGGSLSLAGRSPPGNAHGIWPFAALFLPEGVEVFPPRRTHLPLFRASASSDIGNLSCQIQDAPNRLLGFVPSDNPRRRPFDSSGDGRCCPGVLLFQVCGPPLHSSASSWRLATPDHQPPEDASGSHPLMGFCRQAFGDIGADCCANRLVNGPTSPSAS